MELNLKLIRHKQIINLHEARTGAEFKVNTIETNAQISSIVGTDNRASTEVGFF